MGRKERLEKDGKELYAMEEKIAEQKGNGISALAVALGLIFKTEITDFVNKTFEGLDGFN